MLPVGGIVVFGASRTGSTGGRGGGSGLDKAGFVGEHDGLDAVPGRDLGQDSPDVEF